MRCSIDNKRTSMCALDGKHIQLKIPFNITQCIRYMWDAVFICEIHIWFKSLHDDKYIVYILDQQNFLSSLLQIKQKMKMMMKMNNNNSNKKREEINRRKWKRTKAKTNQMVCILCNESSKQYPGILNVGEWFMRLRLGSSSDETNKSSGTESERQGKSTN